MEILQRVWHDIRRGENIDLYVTVVAALSLSALNLFGLQLTSLIFPVTLALIALIAISMLGSRHQMEETLSAMVQTKDSIVIDRFPDNMRSNIEDAKVLWMVGVSFLSTLQEYYPVFENKLRKGHHINALVVNPSGAACKLAATRDQIVDVEYQQSRIRTTLRYLSALQKHAPDKIEIRIIENPLDFEIIFADCSASRKIMYLKHFGFKTPLGTEPKMVIHSKNPQWFHYFENHLRNLWGFGVNYKEAGDDLDD